MTKPRTIWSVHKNLNTPIIFVTDESKQVADDWAKKNNAEIVLTNPKRTEELDFFIKKFNEWTDTKGILGVKTKFGKGGKY